MSRWYANGNQRFVVLVTLSDRHDAGRAAAAALPVGILADPVSSGARRRRRLS